jgi:hypothetical protein
MRMDGAGPQAQAHEQEREQEHRRVVASSSSLSQLGGLDKRRCEVLELGDEELGAGGDELDEAGGDELDEESGDEVDGADDEDMESDDREFVPASPEAEAEAAAHAGVQAAQAQAQDRAHAQGQAEEHDAHAHKTESDDGAPRAGPRAGRAPARAAPQATQAYVGAVSESDDESMPRAPRDVAAPRPLESLGKGRELGPVPAPAALVAPMTVSSYSVSVAGDAGGVLTPAGMSLPLSTAPSPPAKSVAAGKERARPYSWSELETAKLKLAVNKHGRDWAALAKAVGSKSAVQCRSKVALLVKGGRMSTVRKMTHNGRFGLSSSKEDAALDATAQLDQHEAQLLEDEARGVSLERATGIKRRRSNWLPDEEARLNEALERDTRVNLKRDWAAIAGHVATKTILQCETKVRAEVSAGRMAKHSQQARGHDALAEHPHVPMLSLPPQLLLAPQPLLPAALFPPAIHDSAAKLLGLPVGTAATGSAGAGSGAVLAGSHGAPASDGKPRIKERRARWTEDEIAKLEQAVLRHGTKWADVTRELGGTKTARNCKKKVAFEVAMGRMQKPTACRSYSSPPRCSPQPGGEHASSAGGGSGIGDCGGDDDGNGGGGGDDDNDDNDGGEN